MSTAFTLPDSLSLDDLHTFLSRAAAVEDGAVRVVAGGGVLAAYVGVLSPAGILDSSPTVLGLRTYALAPGEAQRRAEQRRDEPQTADDRIDAVVPIRGMLERLVRLQNAVVDPTAPIEVTLPPTVVAASWAAISPPRGGWAAQSAVHSSVLEMTAKAGIEEVAAVIPTGTGEQIVQKVRAGVWNRPIETAPEVPGGAAFAALTLGFLSSDEPTRVFTSGAWTRLSTSRGHVLVKRRTSLL